MTDSEQQLMAQIQQLLKTNQIQSEQITKLNEQLTQLTEQLAYLTRKRYGVSSEQNVPGQTNLFDPFELPETTEEQTASVAVPSYTRKKKRCNYAELLADLPVSYREHTLSHDDRQCISCGTLMTECGLKEVHTAVKYHPATLEKIIDRQHSYACPYCKDHGVSAVVKSAPIPIPAFPHSFASPELVAQIADQKFELGTPLYRQQITFRRLGLKLADRTMVNWLIKSSQILEPVYQALHTAAVKQSVLHADETPSQVIRRSDGRPGTSKARIWILRTGVDSDRPVVYYQANLTRSQESANQLLAGFKGSLITDGYKVYQNMPGILGAYCWAHVRRKFFEAGAGKGAEGVKIIDGLFMIERELVDRTPQERLNVRQKRSFPIVIKFWQWLDSFHSLAKSKLGEAVTYVRNLQLGLLRFLTDGRLMISNNLAERGIRPITIGRKNWLFSTSEAGAHANVVLQTLIRTAIENGLDAEKYLTKLLADLPREVAADSPVTDAYLPWNQKIQQSCAKV